MVWRLSEFQKADLRVITTKHKQRAVASPHVTKCALLPETGITFPLEADYERVNQALFDQSVVNNDEDAMTMAHHFDAPGRGLSNLWDDGHIPAAVFPPVAGDDEDPF